MTSQININQKKVPMVTNNRIEIADVLRGFAVMGITLIHFIERFTLLGISY